MKRTTRSIETNTTTPQRTREMPIVKSLEPMKETKVTISMPMIIIAVAIVLAGGFTGYILAGSRGGTGAQIENGGTTSEGLKKIVGVQDEKTFPDNTEGILREGGIEGEGTHHLEKDGGPSQYVYLTSSVVPLDDYMDKKVKVWGQTQTAEKAGWLMDVGRLELLE